MATNYTLKRGEYLTIKGTATDQDGNAVDISSGYTFAASVKKNLSDTDLAAYVSIDSTAQSSRFTVSGSTITIAVMLTSESNAAEIVTYKYDAWAVETSSSQETPVETGDLTITDTPTDNKL